MTAAGNFPAAVLFQGSHIPAESAEIRAFRAEIYAAVQNILASAASYANDPAGRIEAAKKCEGIIRTGRSDAKWIERGES